MFPRGSKVVSLLFKLDLLGIPLLSFHRRLVCSSHLRCRHRHPLCFVNSLGLVARSVAEARVLPLFFRTSFPSSFMRLALIALRGVPLGICRGDLRSWGVRPATAETPLDLRSQRARRAPSEPHVFHSLVMHTPLMRSKRLLPAQLLIHHLSFTASASKWLLPGSVAYTAGFIMVPTIISGHRLTFAHCFPPGRIHAGATTAGIHSPFHSVPDPGMGSQHSFAFTSATAIHLAKPVTQDEFFISVVTIFSDLPVVTSRLIIDNQPFVGRVVI